MTVTEPAQALKDFQPRHEFLIGVDSDGSVFDTMAIKHRQCLCPAMIECFGLQPVAQAARECMDFAGLFSKSRGMNRYKTLKRILAELLPGHPLVKERGFEVPRLPHYFAWVDDPASVLSKEGLQQAIAKATGPARKELELALDWNDRVNQAIERIVKNVPPFPFARKCLEVLQGKADVIVLSTAPLETLIREWNKHNVARYVAVIAGQEMGAKVQHLSYTAKGKYKDNHVLMIGDALGDLAAARANNALFYPINPSDEDASWQRFHDQALDKFLTERYAGAYEQMLIEEFDSRLPEKSPWAR